METRNDATQGAQFLPSQMLLFQGDDSGSVGSEASSEQKDPQRGSTKYQTKVRHSRNMTHTPSSTATQELRNPLPTQAALLPSEMLAGGGSVSQSLSNSGAPCAPGGTAAPGWSEPREGVSLHREAAAELRQHEAQDKHDDLKPERKQQNFEFTNNLGVMRVVRTILYIQALDTLH